MCQPLRWTRHEQLAITRNGSLGREEYLDWMTFQSDGPAAFTELFGPMIGLKEQWLRQGACASELDFSAFRYRCPEFAWLPVNTGRLAGPDPVVLEETEEYIVSRDDLGRTMKRVKTAASLPVPLDYPVQTMDDWLAIKPRYTWDPRRRGADWHQAAEAHRAAGRVVTVSIPGGFDEPRQLMGEQGLCLACFDQPELLADMLTTFADTAERVLAPVAEAGVVDRLFVHEDMAGKSGPLLGPTQIRQFIAPYYRRVWQVLSAGGVRLFDQDSDGNMDGVVEAFLEAGVNCMHPIEPAAGMDPVALRQRYGDRLALRGGIDKHVLRRSKHQIASELRRKIPPLVRTGGYEIALDHRVPNGTPLENYRFYVETVWQILAELEAG